MNLKEQLKKNSQENSREIIEQRKEKEGFEKILNIVYGEIVEELEWMSRNGYTFKIFELGGMISDFIEKIELDDMDEYIDDFYDYRYEYDDEETLKQIGFAKIKEKYFTYAIYAPGHSAATKNHNLCVFKDPNKIINFFKTKLKEDGLLDCTTFNERDETEMIEWYYEYKKTEGLIDFLLEGEERRIKRKKVLGKGYRKIEMKINWS